MAKGTSLTRRSNPRERGDVNGRELRRSPRFLPKNEAEEIPTKKKKQQPSTNSKKPSADKTLPSSPDQRGMSPIKKTKNHHRGFSTKCRKEPLRSIGNLQMSPVLRRSARSASNTTEVGQEKGKMPAPNPNPNPNPRRSPRLAAIAGKENVEETRQHSVRPEESAKIVEKERREKKKMTRRGKVVEKEETKRVKRDNKAILEEAEEEEREEKNKKTKNEIENNCQEKPRRKEKMAAEFVGFQGWTMEQEAVLQRAYLVAKPSPHFWKKVSKMVPGKSAQECFDRVNSSLETPQPRPRSKSCRSNLSPIGTFSLSHSKCRKPAVPPVRKLSSRKKNLVAQKTVRHLLRKHCLVDQTREADYFTVLETSPDSLATEFPDIRSPEPPGSIPSIPSFLQKCSEESSSGCRKMMSRFKLSSEADGPSPVVLKKIKNMALHEKYIDQLHCREARRNFAKTSSTIVGEKDCVPKGALLKAAKTALMSEAREVLSEFKHMKANSHVNVNRDDADDDYDGYNDEDEDEEGS